MVFDWIIVPKINLQISVTRSRSVSLLLVFLIAFSSISVTNGLSSSHRLTYVCDPTKIVLFEKENFDVVVRNVKQWPFNSISYRINLHIIFFVIYTDKKMRDFKDIPSNKRYVEGSLASSYVVESVSIRYCMAGHAYST